MWLPNLALIIKSFMAAIIFASTLVVIMTIGPAIETKYFPVVEKLKILKMESMDGGTAIYAAFKKVRACEYVGIAWYHGKQSEQFDRVAIAIWRPPGDISSPNRPIGYVKTGPWLVAIPITDIEKNSFVQLFHRCNPFWLTTTEFYP